MAIKIKTNLAEVKMSVTNSVDNSMFDDFHEFVIQSSSIELDFTVVFMYI